ncbi:MAG: hypothetical protein HY553_12710 [Elusimicrobia bacterium]|nr:hypothetical protein [Elusimicrobiota bacterium]
MPIRRRPKGLSGPCGPGCAAGAATSIAVVWTLWSLWTGNIVWTPAFLAFLGGLAWLWSVDPRPWETRPTLLVFLACAALYLSTFRWHGGDDIPTTLVPFALLRDGTFRLDGWLSPFLDGGKAQDFTLRFGDHRISIYPVAGALMALPVFLLPALSGIAPSEPFMHNISKVSATLIAAGSVAVLYRALAAKASRGWALWLAFLFGLGTWSFSLSSQALWQHGPACLGLALGVWGMTQRGFRWDALAGFGFALAAASRPDNFWLAAGAGLCVLFHRTGRVPGFSLGASVPAALLLTYWLYYTGRPVPPESEMQKVLFAGFQPEAFVALLVSPTRGLLWYSPYALLGAWAATRRGASAESRWFLGASVAAWVFFACYGPWVGGNTFGARYFAGICLLMTFALAEAEREFRASAPRLRLLAAAGCASIVVHALGAYLNWPGSSHLPTAKLQAWHWSLHPWLFLLSPEGSLRAMPWAARALIAAAVAGAAAWAAIRLGPDPLSGFRQDSRDYGAPCRKS